MWVSQLKLRSIILQWSETFSNSKNVFDILKRIRRRKSKVRAELSWRAQYLYITMFCRLEYAEEVKNVKKIWLKLKNYDLDDNSNII